jgi:hypothetical protein
MIGPEAGPDASATKEPTVDGVSSSLPSLLVSHSFAEGTLVTGTSRGDASAEVLRRHRLRWSRNLDAWYVPRSRDRASRGLDRLAEDLRGAGFAVQLDVDDTPTSVADRETARAERSAQRAAGLEVKAQRLAERSDQDRAVVDGIHSMIPPGQPILVGHHSERRHRRDLQRADDAMRRSVENHRAAQAAAAAADTARAMQDRRDDPVFVGRRIDQWEADLRSAQRSRREDRIAEAEDQLAYWRGLRDQLVAAGQARVWTRADLEVGDLVKIRGRWQEVAKANPKTVAVWTVMPWPLKYPYSEIQGHQRTSDQQRAQLRSAREA